MYEPYDEDNGLGSYLLCEFFGPWNLWSDFIDNYIIYVFFYFDVKCRLTCFFLLKNLTS